MRWDRGFARAKCPTCRGALGEDLKCAAGHGTFVPKGALDAGAAPPPHRPFTGEEPQCPGCRGPMDVVLEAGDEVLISTCKHCDGLWLAMGDTPMARELLRG